MLLCYYGAMPKIQIKNNQAQWSFIHEKSLKRIFLNSILTKATINIYLWYMKTQVNLKIDNDVKIMAQKRASELGLSLSSIVNATLKQFARTGVLELSTTPRATPFLEDLVTEARKEYSEGKTSGPFDNVEDLMKHLNS